MINNDRLVEILHFRHACKIFDTTKKIPKDDIISSQRAVGLLRHRLLQHWRLQLYVTINYEQKQNHTAGINLKSRLVIILIAVIAKPRQVPRITILIHSKDEDQLLKQSEAIQRSMKALYVSSIVIMIGFCHLLLQKSVARSIQSRNSRY